MLKKTLLSLSLLVAIGAQAQNTLPAAPSTNGGGSKKELVARIVRAQQGAIEGMARQITERPALEILNGAMQVIAARVPKDKQEAVAKDVQAEAQKYVDSAVPIVSKRAVEVAPAAMGGILEEKFSEEELRTIASLLENPTVLKFQRMLPDMQQALGEKLVADTRPQIEPKVQALDATVSKKLGLPPPGAAAPAAPSQGKAPARKQ
ncbi:MAG TPA: hypothetical protein VMZ74_16630 [Ramlibacter sp.]|nr:hypothetical protein [Ramlibacter sp.]